MNTKFNSTELNNSLALSKINKSFGKNQVLFDVSLTFYTREVHALVGENGAGKSTLMNIISGIIPADSGTIQIDGNVEHITSPTSAQKKGIMLMHQELSVFPEMSVAENIFVGHLPNSFGVLSKKEMYERASEILEKLECGISASEKVKNLSIANQHICEFARFLSMKSKYIILDEPTAALTEREKDIIFKFIKNLKDTYNLGIIYISHRMHEIYEIADKVSILRDGYLQGTFDIKDIQEEEITRLMVGYDIGKIEKQSTTIEENSIPVLEVNDLCIQNDVKDINFSIRKGEILGLAGLLGARRTEIAEAIFGIRNISSGSIKINGKKLDSNNVQNAINNSIAYVPSDRKLQGLILRMNCIENVTLSILKQVQENGILSSKKEVKVFSNFKKLFDIKTQSPKQSAGELSGGNQQKIVLSKWLATEPSLLILDEPTRGIDVGAKAEIYRLIQELSLKGYAILLITSDMLELLTLSTRVLAVYDGKMSRFFNENEINEEAIINAISKIDLTSGS